MRKRKMNSSSLNPQVCYRTDKTNTKSVLFLVFLFAVALTGCTQNTQTPLLMEPEREAKTFTAKALAPQQKVASKVDILFVLDNSKSMGNEIAFLKSNAPKFTRELKKYPQVDPHIGVLYVHDSSRYTNNSSQSNGVLKINPQSGVQQYYEKGELVPLNSSTSTRVLGAGELDLLPEYFNIDVPFVARNKSVKGADGKTVEQYAVGPEIEESFSPVLAAVQNPSYQNRFFRKDALLVVIFVTDAETGDIPEDKLKSNPELTQIVENILPQELFNQLLIYKEGKVENLLVYGVLCELSDTVCQNNGVEKPAQKIRSFVEMVHSKRKAESLGRLDKSSSKLSQSPILNLRSSNWGEKLASIGAAIGQETLLRPIRLSFVPEIKKSKNTLKPEVEVSLGKTVLKYKTHWIYDASENTVTLLPSVLALKTKGEFDVKGVAVDMGSAPTAIR